MHWGPKSLGVSVDPYYPWLMGYACILLENEAARDVVQDVFDLRKRFPD